MKNGLKTGLIFSAGAMFGFIVANLLLKDKYEKKCQEDISEVKQRLRKHADKVTDTNANVSSEESDRTAYVERLQEFDYAAETELNTDDENRKPRVISPDEFGEVNGYEVISLTYYADKVLTDTRDMAMSNDDIEDMVGLESLKHFGEYENDAVFVRNDRLKTDFEILLDERCYRDVLEDMPYIKY